MFVLSDRTSLCSDGNTYKVNIACIMALQWPRTTGSQRVREASSCKSNCMDTAAGTSVLYSASYPTVWIPHPGRESKGMQQSRTCSWKTRKANPFPTRLSSQGWCTVCLKMCPWSSQPASPWYHNLQEELSSENLIWGRGRAQCRCPAHSPFSWELKHEQMLSVHKNCRRWICVLSCPFLLFPKYFLCAVPSICSESMKQLLLIVSPRRTMQSEICLNLFCRQKSCFL